MILTRQSDSQSPAGQLWEMLAKAVAMGADAVEFERESGGVEVMWFKGGTGIGVLLETRAGEAIIHLIIDLALKKRVRGKLSFEREGQIHDVRVETYESFGERCYRLNMGKGKPTERQTIDKNKTG